MIGFCHAVDFRATDHVTGFRKWATAGLKNTNMFNTKITEFRVAKVLVSALVTL